MTNNLNQIGKWILALLVPILATPAWAKPDAAPPVVPKQKEIDTSMDMAQQMMGMLPQIL